MELIALSGIALLTAILVSRAVGTEYRIIGCLGTKAERCVCDVLPEY